MNRRAFLTNITRAAAAVGLGVGAGRLCIGRDGCARTVSECMGCAMLPDCEFPQADEARMAVSRNSTPPR